MRATRRADDDFQPQITRWGHVWRLGLSLLTSVGIATDVFPAFWDEQRWRIPIDLAPGAAAFVLVQYRRRHPFGVAVLTMVLATFSTMAAGPAILATVSVATRRVYWQLAVMALLNIISALTFFEITPSHSDESLLATMIVTVALTLAMLAWGMYIGSRRELLWTLRQRAERAESERDLRVSKAKADERAGIAREMHDVLAQRISQVAMHAGALSFRTDLSADELRSGIGEVQARANEALIDLRSVLGVLRDPDTGDALRRPQPSYDDLHELVTEARAAGIRVELADHVHGDVPTQLGRTLYRIVQEGITNASKHAPGSVLTVEIDGDDRRGVEVVLRNPLGFGAPAAPGAGLGLVGLAERVQLAGGQFSHQRQGSSFVVRASLPWAT